MFFDLSIWDKVCKLAKQKNVSPEKLASSFIDKVKTTRQNFFP